MEQIQQWIEIAAAQLRCRKAVPGVQCELESHLYEQYNAFLEQGCTAAEAQRKTVESMGDPVLAGGALDRIHRPRPAWGPFCAAAALLLMGGILRWWQSIPLAADGTLLWHEGSWQTLFVTEISILVLALVHFCMDVSLLSRWAWQIYLGLLVFSGCGILLGDTIINGRRYWALPFFGLYSAFDFALLFAPVYAAVVYRQRGRGWRGFCICCAALLPGLMLCLYAPQIVAVILLAVTGLVLGVLCCRNDWFCIGKRHSLCALCLTVPAMLAVPLLVLLRCFGAGLPVMLARMFYVFRIDDPAGADYWLNGLQRMWDGMHWFSPGDAALLLSEQTGLLRVEEFVGQGASALCADSLPALLGWRLGAFWAFAVVAAIAGGMLWLWHTANQIRSSIGRLCAVSVCTLLSGSGLLYLCGSFGWHGNSSMLPFFGSSVDMIVQAAVIGLLLSAFRLDTVLHEPSAAPRRAPDAA